MRSILSIIVLWAMCCRAHGADAAAIAVSLKPDAPSSMVGGPVLLHLAVENASTEVRTVEILHRLEEMFTFECPPLRPLTAVPHDYTAYGEKRPAFPVKLAPKDSYERYLTLDQWMAFSEPGDYTINWIANVDGARSVGSFVLHVKPFDGKAALAQVEHCFSLMAKYVNLDVQSDLAGSLKYWKGIDLARTLSSLEQQPQYKERVDLCRRVNQPKPFD